MFSSLILQLKKQLTSSHIITYVNQQEEIMSSLSLSIVENKVVNIN